MPNPKSFPILLLCIFFSGNISNASSRDGERVISFGITQSLKGIGFCADFTGKDGYFSSVTVTADLADIIYGNASLPGVKLTYHCNLILAEIPDNNIQFYAGPGLTAGHVRNLDEYFGFMAGVSGDAGVRIFCKKSISLALEVQADFSLIFKNKRHPDMGLYSAGFRNSYFPHLKIQYCF